MKAFKKYTAYDDNDVKISYSNNSNMIHKNDDIPKHSVVVDSVPLPYITNNKKESLDIRVKYWPGMPLLEQWECGGCIDLYNYEEVSLSKGDFSLINLGIAMELPEGYDALLLPRSSCFKNYGLILVNTPGYIDNSYNGPNDTWYAPVLATRDIIIPQFTRCFQFRLIQTQPKNISFIISNLENNLDRNGIGSTGV